MMKRLVIVLSIMAGSLVLANPAFAESDTTSEAATAAQESPPPQPPPVDTPPPADSPPVDSPPATPPPADSPPATPPADSPAPADEPPAAPDPAAADQPALGTPDPAVAKSSLVKAAAVAGPSARAVKLTICHRTDSDTNPYVQNAPSVSGVFHGHDKKHDGPVWDPTLKAKGIKWGDIIPPYTYKGTNYPGQNWDAAGILIYNAGCTIPGVAVVPLTPVTATAPSKTPPTCSTNGSLVIPTVAHVNYESTPSGTGPGTYTVTAFAKVGYELVGTASWTVTVLPDLNGKKCEPDKAAAVVQDLPLPDVVTDVVTDDEGVLPNTGGTPLWLLLLGAALTAAGAVTLLGSRRPVTAGGQGRAAAPSRSRASANALDWDRHQDPLSTRAMHRRAKPGAVAGLRARILGRMRS
jgi:hypothetical protein